MPKPRTSTAALVLKGSFRKNPQRFAARSSEPDEMRELGPAPKRKPLTFAEAWRYIVATAPPGVLKHRDRLLVEEAAALLMLLRKNGSGAQMNAFIRFESVLSKMGLTPSDASRVFATTTEINEFDQFD